MEVPTSSVVFETYLRNFVPPILQRQYDLGRDSGFEESTKGGGLQFVFEGVLPSQSMTLARFLSRTQRRALHQTRVRYAISNLEMPAMSPTMTEGSIVSWKKREGESFSAGDVPLEIDTDKATIDVEAQDDGILGKIIVLDGSKNVQVGRVIAFLAEEGDDVSNLEAPKEQLTSAPQPAAPKTSVYPKHPKHLLPSVIRLLIEGGVADAEAIPATGVRGMLTKGDVLAYLGRASSPMGTYKEAKEVPEPKKAEETKPLNGVVIRQLIVAGLAAKIKSMPAPKPPATFDAIIADYFPLSYFSPEAAPTNVLSQKPRHTTSGYFDGLL